MLRPLRSIFARFRSIFGTIFDPETLQNEFRDPIEKNAKSWYPFFQFLTNFWTIFGPPKSPKNKKTAPDTTFNVLWSLFAPGRPRASILIDFLTFSDRFVDDV